MQVKGRKVGAAAGLVAGVVSVGLLVAGCGPMGTVADSPAAPVSPAGAAVGNGPPALQASVAAGSTTVSPGEPITVAAVRGTLNDVKLVNQAGTVVPGSTSPDGTKWTSSGQLGYGKRYTLTAGGTSTDPARTPLNAAATFSTVTARTLTLPYLTPSDGEVVGVGQPIAVKFDEKITDKAAAEKAISITTTPKVEGAFYWFNSQEVRWRPENHWAPRTKVTVDVNVYGRNLGNGTYGQEDRHIAFSIGDEVISTVDDATKNISVAINGAVVKTMPTSMGKNGTPTEHGVFIVGDKHASMIMDSETFGLPNTGPGGYKVPVKWATRMSYGGVFVHAAPWSVDSQGETNVSHGCLNVSTTNAQWFYEHAKRGDLVIVNGTRGPLLRGTEGLGDWNIPWSTWKAGGGTN